MNLTEQSKEDITDDVIESRDVEDKNFKQQYLQKTITFLTEENLDKLKKHCNKAIHYERGIEHKVVLELLQKYKEYLAEREADKKRIKELEEELVNKENKIWKLKETIQDLENECISLHELIDEEM